MSSTGSPNMSLPVLIISFNNHEFAANTVAQLERFGIEDIVVVDNASDREETRAWLDSLRHRVIRNAGNYGHLCWARPEIYDTLPDRFCVTDPTCSSIRRCPPTSCRSCANCRSAMAP